MKISAQIDSPAGEHQAIVQTGDQQRSLTIPPKPEGLGSSVNGGELLFLALATCYCNDIYREARKRNIRVQRVGVEVKGEFGAEGEPARNIEYSASVEAHAPQEEILALMQHTDSVAEIQNTLRTIAGIRLTHCETRQLT